MGNFKIDWDTKLDIRWWLECANKHNGISLILNPDWEKPDSVFSTDACLKQAGRWSGEEYWHCAFPEWILMLTQDINHFECWAILIALRVWGSKCARKNCLIFCDNLNTVLALNSGSSRDKIMQRLLRNIHWECVHSDMIIRSVHIAGVNNRFSDLLSRWAETSNWQNKFNRMTRGRQMRKVEVNASLFVLNEA